MHGAHTPHAVLVYGGLLASALLISLAGIAEHQHAQQIGVALALCLPAIFYSLSSYMRLKP